MSLDTIVSVQITKATASVTRAGFGTPILMSNEAKGLSAFSSVDSKEYDDLASVVSDGFSTTGIAYKKASELFGQSPKVSKIIIAKRAHQSTQLFVVVPFAVNSTAYKIKVNGVEFTYTSDGSATVAEIVAGLVAAISPSAWANTHAYSTLGVYVTNDSGKIYKVITTGTSAGSGGPTGTSSDITDGTVHWAYVTGALGVTATDNGGAHTSVLLTGTAGTPFHIETEDRSLMSRYETTADPGIAADVTTVRESVSGSDDWYAILLDTGGLAETLALAAYIETIPRIFIATSGDSDIIASGSSDIASQLKSASYSRTALIFHLNPQEAADAAWAGVCLPLDPGTETWKFKTLVGVDVYTLSAAERAYAVGKNANIYELVAGNNMTAEGTMADGEFIDTIRGIDFCVARMKENVFFVLKNSTKVPFTDKGVATVVNQVQGVLNLCVSQGVFAADPAPTITYPKVADVDANDRADRILPDINFTAQLAGAIHTVQIAGTVSV